MTFNFRFASILKLRRHQEQLEKQKLGTLFHKKRILKQRYAALEEKNGNEIPSFSEQTVMENRRYYAQKHTLHKHLMQLKQDISQINAELEKQRKQLAKANTQTRMMEKIKENEKRAFIRHAEHVEQLQQNEIAIQRFNTDY